MHPVQSSVEMRAEVDSAGKSRLPDSQFGLSCSITPVSRVYGQKGIRRNQKFSLAWKSDHVPPVCHPTYTRTNPPGTPGSHDHTRTAAELV
jgi:hypothetical protein